MCCMIGISLLPVWSWPLPRSDFSNISLTTGAVVGSTSTNLDTLVAEGGRGAEEESA